MKFDKTLSLVSLIIVIILSFIPNVGIKVVDEVFRSYYFGFPALWLGYHKGGGGQFSFQVFNLIFDFLFFYLIFWLIKKLIKKIAKLKRKFS
ncbi:hypothetical protein ACFC4S_23235 [Priestia megaterium]|uniref:hypothetical protein n=1 Tax=Priestia megaterium TaxID=1404 RepID=UPI0035E2E2E6